MIAGIVFAVALYSGARKVVGGSFERVAVYLIKDISNYITDVADFANYLLTPVLIIGLWLWIRGIPRFSNDKAGILFSSSNSDELESEVLDLRSRVHTELKARDLLDLIEVRTLPPNIKITDIHIALSKVREANAALLVWGFFESSQVMGQRVTGFNKLNFTYSHPSNVSIKYHKEVALSLLGRKLAFAQDNEFIEKAIVVNNIAQVSLNIVGMILLVKGLFDKAEAVFAVLDIELEPSRLSPTTIPPLRTFCTNIRKNRVRAIAAQVQKEYRLSFHKPGIYHASSSQLARWKAKITEAIKLDK